MCFRNSSIPISNAESISICVIFATGGTKIRLTRAVIDQNARRYLPQAKKGRAKLIWQMPEHSHASRDKERWITI